MNWLSIVGGLVGVVGLLFGLLWRAIARRATERADTISKAHAQALVDMDALKVRHGREIANLEQNVKALIQELHENLPAEKLAARLGDLLRWRVPASKAGTDTGWVP